MPRGEHPNSRANLRKAYNGRGGFDTESARRAKDKSDESKQAYKTLTEDLKERMTAARVGELNEKLYQMARHGNLRAYELIRDGLGEKPCDKSSVDMTVNEGSRIIYQLHLPYDGMEDPDAGDR